MDLSFIAESIGAVAFAYATIKIAPLAICGILIGLNKATLEDVKELTKIFEKKRRL